MGRIGLDRPWRRPGRAAYARTRWAAARRPPVTVYEMPADVRKDTDIEVRLRDGVILRLNLYRPAAAAGPLPTLLSAHPYGKDNLPKRRRGGWSLNPQFRIMNQPEPFRISDQTSWEAPDPVWWGQQGYAVVNLDVRGGGRSSGRGALLSDQEADDIAQVIAWIAAQPWSNRRVGMLGVSYLALSQYKVAALNPPALKAICPWEGFTDAYRDFFLPGGIVEDGFARIWMFLTSRVARMDKSLATARREHPLRDGAWDAVTPDLGRIAVPILECTSFSDANLHSVGSMRAFQRVSSVERHAYAHRGPKWSTFYSDEAHAFQRAFFDRHLRGLTDAPVLAPMRLEIRDRRENVVEVRDEREWPLARTQWRRLHLADAGTLSDVEPAAGAITFCLRRDAAAFDYTFREDTELTGPMALRLHVATQGARDPRLFVGIEKRADAAAVGFEGSYGYGRDRVAQGRLRLALRALDPQLSVPHQPEHAFRALQPLPDGETVPIDIPLSPSATLFRTGESLRLLVAGRFLEPRNPLFGHFPTHYRPSRSGRATLSWGPGLSAYLEIPVIPSAAEGRTPGQ